ncbi:hypothetical protein BDN67DRAFT_916778 [Paxillus ammoniavirescens]|nr:hypothetical protein BDN67DRAFT_916778 [Paxillus ammoniavirescens]
MAQYHPTSGYIYGEGKNVFEQMKDNQYHGSHKDNPYVPFTGAAEWPLSKFLTENLTQAQINFLWVLYWTIYTNHEQEFREWFTGNEAFNIQDNLPEGATIVPIIAASDKTPVTQHTGGLEMNPLFLTRGNIDLDIHMKASAHVWCCITFMPIPKFETHPNYQTILQTRVWHKCADLVTANLKHAAVHGDFMVDPFGQLWLSFSPLVAWMADLPEQLMIACVSKNASPVTEATHKQFGDGGQYTVCTGEMTLQHIYDAAQTINTWDLHQFQKHVKTKLLSGVHLPFWHDWHLSNPSVFLVPV